MHGLAALCHTARKGGYIGSRSTYTWRASSLLDKKKAASLARGRLHYDTNYAVWLAAPLSSAIAACAAAKRAIGTRYGEQDT